MSIARRAYSQVVAHGDGLVLRLPDESSRVWRRMMGSVRSFGCCAGPASWLGLA